MQEYYVIGDIHGQYGAMHRLLEQKPKQATTVYLGDIIDRGTGCLKALREVSAGYKAGNHLVIQGNHEEMLKKYIEEDEGEEEKAYFYLLNGGTTLVEQYYAEQGKRPPMEQELGQELEEAYRSYLQKATRGATPQLNLRQILSYGKYVLPYFSPTQRQRYREQISEAIKQIRHDLRTGLAEELAIMQTYLLYYESEDWLMCHAGVNPATEHMKDMKEWEMKWLRNDFYEAKTIACTDKRIVFGHTSNDQIHAEVAEGSYTNYVWESANRQLVGIDTGVSAMFTEYPYPKKSRPLVAIHTIGKHYEPYIAKKEIVYM